MRWLRGGAMALLFGALAACATGSESVARGSNTIYLVSHGWHTGIVLPWDERVARVWPSNLHLGRRYVEVGWGERDFYPAPGFSSGLALKALLWRNDSVLHLVAFDAPPSEYFPASAQVQLGLDADGYARLIAALGASFVRDAPGGARMLGPGLYGDSRFYLSRESYHLFNTCNVWTAEKLALAGLPFVPWRSITTGQLLRQARAVAAP